MCVCSTLLASVAKKLRWHGRKAGMFSVGWSEAVSILRRGVLLEGWEAGGQANNREAKVSSRERGLERMGRSEKLHCGSPRPGRELMSGNWWSLAVSVADSSTSKLDPKASKPGRKFDESY